MDLRKIAKNKFFYLIVLAAVVLISLLVIRPLLHPGFFPMHDDTQIGRVGQMSQAIQDGEFPVRWVKELGFGYGYPVFNFYSPLPFYIGATFHLIGFNILDATKIVFALALLLAGITMFFFACEFFGITAAAVAAVLYVYFPYHAVDTYVRGDLDELLAYAFLPLVFLSFYKLYYYAKGIQVSFPIRWVLLLAVSMSLVVLSHNLTAYMSFIFLVPLFIVSLFFVPRKLPYIIWFVVAAILTMSLSAFYILPALSEMRLTNIMSQIGGGSYFADHFVCPSQLWYSPWGYGGSVKGCVDGMSFMLGKDNILFALLAFLIFIVSWLWRDYSDFFLKMSLFLALAFSLFLILPVSDELWKIVPYMNFLQFPWRFLMFTGFFMSVIIAMGVSIVQRTFPVPKLLLLIVAVMIIGSTVWYNTKLFVPQRYAIHPVSYYTSKEYLRWYVSKQSSEYLPKNFKQVTSAQEIVTRPVSVIFGNAILQSVTQKTTSLYTTIRAAQPSAVRVNLAYFSNWHFRLDGHAVPITVQSNGVLVPVPAGVHKLEVQYTQTPIEYGADAVSVIGLLAVLILVFRVQYKRLV